MKNRCGFSYCYAVFSDYKILLENRTHNPQLHARPTTCKRKRQVPQAATICISVELLMMGVMVPETCRANDEFCNKKPICCIWLAVYFHVLNDDARSNSHQVRGLEL